MIGTFALVFIASAVGKAGPGIGEAPLVGLVVWAVGLSLGATTGYAINPARDLGPRLAHAVLPELGHPVAFRCGTADIVALVHADLA
mgnify:CR=1 FL=1